MEFKTKEAAMEAAKELGKKEYLIATVGGKKAFLSNTSIPVDMWLREPMQVMITDFLKEVGFESVAAEENAIDIAPRLQEVLEKELKNIGVEIISPYYSF